MNTTTQELSDYQRAVLNELGILCWKKQANASESEQYEAVAKHHTSALHKPLPETASKESALNKLQQLKSPQPSVSYAGKVLCTFTPSAEFSALMQDVMFALELSDYPLISLTKTELAQAKDYVLVWQCGDEVEISASQLTTPELNHLNNPSFKKSLWQLIQNYSA
ncbi:DNA polymerase III subunit psi [Paraglaciecola sp.]|uniref:DNA polymerase III subunit psi n=1 Tax=Paraglaciecola sp. TaxID=1920173 RepID=UPI0030F43E75